ncbi:MAG: lysostaphin resistance A-like protein [Lachnospiraceae bacterium]
MERRESIKRVFYMIAPFAMYYVCLQMVATLLTIFIREYAKSSEKMAVFVADCSGTVSGVISLISFLISGMAVFLYYRKKEEMKWKAEPQMCLSAGIGLFLALGLNLLMGYICQNLPVHEEQMERANYNADIPTGLGIVLYVLVSPLVEELVFRWLLLGRIQKHLGIPLAVFTSAVFFGFYHGNILQGIYATMMGLLLALVYVWSGSLWHPVLLHTAANAAIYFTPFLPEKCKNMISSVWSCAIYLIAGVLLISVFYRTYRKKLS